MPLVQRFWSPGAIDNIGDRGIPDLQAASACIQVGPQRSYREHGFGLWRVCSPDSGKRLVYAVWCDVPGLRFPMWAMLGTGDCSGHRRLRMR